MKKILIVEDHPEIRNLMRLTLKEGDFEVHDADDAASGWDAVLRLQPEIVLLDIMMPGEMDGLQLCRRIKDDDRTRATQVVLVSARGHRNDIAIGLDAGADDYLLKPFNPFRLLEVIALLTAKI
jgi:DNA-binding response OmpR family regulator